MTYVNHPAACSAKRTAIVVLFLLAVFVAVYFTTESVVLTAVAVLIMVGSLASFFLPTTYIFDTEGLHIKTMSGKRSFNWGRFRSFYPDKNGVLLSPYLRPSRLENFRGVYIRFADNRETVLEYIDNKLTANRANDEKGEDN
ncbi:MAG: hypothetical protein GF307_10100 [candidate division Zixibacteria bacterium]|nr:hypothetical protein [candidate division Zixibacteria bacterium]